MEYTDHTLTNTQRERLFGSVAQLFADPTTFALETYESLEVFDRKVSRLRHIPSGFYFQFDINREGEYVCYISPTENRRHDKVVQDRWSGVSMLFETWLDSINAELCTPDPWQGVAKYAALESPIPASEASNVPFSIEELSGIWKGLSVIQETLLNSQNVENDHRLLINSQMEFLLESSKTMGRKDWLILAVGSLVTIATAMSLSTETTRTIFQLLKRAVAGAVQLLGS